MHFKQIFVIFCLFFSIKSTAQDSAACYQKKWNHVLGVQANQLIRQVFNFSNNNPSINNPYLLTYTAYHTRSNWGVDAGLGYTFNNIFDNDGNTKKETYINDLFFRIGVQKQIPLTRKFTSQFSFHILYDLLNNKTISAQEFNFQKTVISSKSNIARFGGGPAMNLRYKINSRVFIGTELNYYFKHGNTKTDVTTTNDFQGQPSQITTSKSDNNATTILLNVPTAIFLQIKW
jgi:hypothetical protein